MGRILSRQELAGNVSSSDMAAHYDAVENARRHIAEIEAALYAALNGVEIVIREGAPAGPLERKVLDDGGILWRRQFVRKE